MGRAEGIAGNGRGADRSAEHAQAEERPNDRAHSARPASLGPEARVAALDPGALESLPLAGGRVLVHGTATPMQTGGRDRTIEAPSVRRRAQPPVPPGGR